MMNVSFDRLTWAGFAVAILGWALLLPALFAPLPLGPLAAARDSVVSLAQMLIVSGLGLAVVGALRSGFSALNRFFEAVLQRAAAKAEAAAEAPEPPEFYEEEIIDRGRIRDRGYVVYADGTVDVETLLGIRRFASLAEARDFIGT